jgi:hypothetical protein
VDTDAVLKVLRPIWTQKKKRPAASAGESKPS